jgi:hypothetical protein
MKWKMNLSMEAWICYAAGYVFIASAILTHIPRLSVTIKTFPSIQCHKSNLMLLL